MNNDKYNTKYKHFLLFLKERNINNINNNTFKIFKEFIEYKVYHIEETNYGLKLLKHFMEFVSKIDTLENRSYFFYNFIILFRNYDSFLRNKKYKDLVHIFIDRIRNLLYQIKDKEKIIKIKYIIDLYKTF